MSTERTTSPSPTRRTLGDKISALGAKISRTLNSNHVEENESDSVAPILQDNERSLSRGREAFSTGRGGLGNIRQGSVSRDARPDTGPDDFSVTRGREPVGSPKAVYSTGRGGAGNLRSPSRDGSKTRPDVGEQEVIREYTAAHEGAPFSSGRGGIGNITRSRSRDPAGSAPRESFSSTATTPSHNPLHNLHNSLTHHSPSRDSSNPPPHVYSTGRGGAGNIVPGDAHAPDFADEEERRARGRAHGEERIHSTGRGGTANLTHVHAPGIEPPQHPESEPYGFQSTGRGGAGNIRDRSASRPRA